MRREQHAPTTVESANPGHQQSGEVMSFMLSTRCDSVLMMFTVSVV